MIELAGQLPRLRVLGLLNAISPSRFLGARQCMLRETLAANGVPRTLPRSAVAVVGSIIHRVLDDCAKGRVTKEQLDAYWLRLVEDTEAGMLSLWQEQHLVPLSKSVRLFEVRRLQTKRRATELLNVARRSDGSSRVGNGKYGSEFHLRTIDGKVFGVADSVRRVKSGAAIRDYKTGRLYVGGDGDSQKVDSSYGDQLRLYAGIYADQFNEWPAYLEIVPLGGEPERISYTREESNALLNAAREMLERINSVISTAKSSNDLQNRLARPSADACSRCGHRPICGPYMARRSRSSSPEDWPIDLFGRLREKLSLRNGTWGISLTTEAGVVHVRGLTDDGARHPALEQLQHGSLLLAFNLRPTASPIVWAQGEYTTLYRPR